jgi:hypothetical protein
MILFIKKQHHEEYANSGETRRESYKLNKGPVGDLYHQTSVFIRLSNRTVLEPLARGDNGSIVIGCGSTAQMPKRVLQYRINNTNNN